MSEENETNLDNTEATGTEETSEQGTDRVAELEEELRKRDGSIKRLKTKLEKSKETPEDKTEEKKSENSDNSLLEKAFLRSASITDKEEVELALKTAKKWDMSIDELVDDDDFKVKLEKHRTNKSNLNATTNVKGDKSGSSAKNTPEYWTAKGTPPTAEQVPDRKERAKIVRAMMKDAKTGKQFYNE